MTTDFLSSFFIGPYFDIFLIFLVNLVLSTSSCILLSFILARMKNLDFPHLFCSFILHKLHNDVCWDGIVHEIVMFIVKSGFLGSKLRSDQKFNAKLKVSKNKFFNRFLDFYWLSRFFLFISFSFNLLRFSRSLLLGKNFPMLCFDILSDLFSQL